MAEPTDFEKELTRLADAVSVADDCDVLLYSGPLRRGFDDSVIRACRSRSRRRPNVLLMASTFGGTADAAYRMARVLQERYKRVILFVYGYCKSAGTLLALGADELVLSDFAELGPLDVQVRKTDEVGESASGLTPTQALDTLKVHAVDLFHYHFKRLRDDIQMTSKMAAQVASGLSGELLGRIYGQIDPMRIGELARSLRSQAILRTRS
jgi:ClpP class serine protease